MLQRLTKGQEARLPEANIRDDSFLQRLFVSWVYAIIAAGRRGQLRPERLCMPRAQAAEVASQRFQDAWAAEQAAAAAGARSAPPAGGGATGGATPGAPAPRPRPPSLLRALAAAFWAQFALAGVFKLVWSGCVLLGASYFVNALIEFVQHKPGWDALPTKGVGWVLACAFFADSLAAGLALQRMGDVAVRVGIAVRGALITAVYRKAFRLQALHGHDAGNVVSLVSTDCIKMYEGVQHCHNVWTAPLEAAAIIGLLLWRTGGVFGLPALGVVMVVLPLQYYFGYKIAEHKMANVDVSDARVLRMHEVLLAIKLVKFYAWERSFAAQVEEVRQRELHLISRTAVIKTLNLCLVFAVPPVIALVIFATYAYSVGPLSPSMAFVVLSLFNTLRFPLVVLPKALRGASEAIAAMRRIQAFLLLPEAEEQVPAAEPQAVISGATLHYGNPSDFSLTVPEFSVRPGEVVAVVGRVGSGKSSVLQAILSKMTLAGGRLHVGGRVAYVPQTPWVQNLSLRDNITFGLPYEEGRYRSVIHACALELDLQILPQGDASLAGERGINLSGGQRQRVCLARAAYHDAQLLLLDNPLSAVDQHTSKHIFDHCIRGLLAEKAVVLIAHQLELLPQCSKVAIVVGGRVAYFGPYSADALAAHMPVDSSASLTDATVEAKESAAAPAEPPAGAHDKHEQAEGGGAEAGGGGLIKAHHGRGPSSAPGDDLVETAEEVAAKFSGTCRRLSAGQAALVYARAGGLPLGVLAACVFAFTQTTRIMGDWWIRSWAADEPARFIALHGVLASNRLYLLIYMALVLLFVGLLLGRDSLFSLWSIRASTRLHNMLFRRVLSAPILFFLRTPVGDVLNAFARDQDTLDETLPDTLHMTGIYLMILLTSLAIVTVSIPWYAVMTGGLFLAFAGVQRLYLPAATALKRWAGESASAVFVHVDESLQGMDVIRAFGGVAYFMQENVNLLNAHHLALFNMEQTHLWLAFWCDAIGAALVVATCLFSVGFSDTLGAPNVGLAISNSIQVLVFFTWVVRGVADTVSMWDAIERVTSYATQVPMEVEADADDSPAPGSPRPQAPPLHHQLQLAGARTASSRLPGASSGSLLFGGPQRGPGSRRHRRTANDRRQASLRITSTSRADPALAAAAAAALADEVGGGSHHGHQPSHLSRAATHQQHGQQQQQQHTTLTVCADSTLAGGQPQEAAAAAGGGSADASQHGAKDVPAVGSAFAAAAKLQLAECGAAAAACSEGAPPGWPATGELSFEDVSLRYFPGAPLALRHITFRVADCEKIGIVGRTGSGKTTLLMGLFRMMALAGGRITLGGLDIASLPLREVRRAVSIIPQEPVMFKGSVRSNLDPFGVASDNELWHALALVHLKPAVAELPGGLDSPVAEGGSNFSLGQKQLMCMARCVLKESRLLVLDEATAAMDLATDRLVQATIRRVFGGVTTLTIAHRLDTIIFSDKILALAQGQVKEFDAPSLLLQEPGSMFNRLVEDTGPVASAMLRTMAAAGPPPDAAARGSASGGGGSSRPASLDHGPPSAVAAAGGGSQ